MSSNTTAAKTIDDDLYKNSIVIPLIVEASIHLAVTVITFLVLVLCRMRKATVMTQRQLAPYLFLLYIAFNCMWHIVVVSLQLSISEQQRQGIYYGLPTSHFGTAAGIADSFDIILGYPLLFAAGMAYIFQTAQYSIMKRYLENVKIQLFQRQQKNSVVSSSPGTPSSPEESQSAATAAIMDEKSSLMSNHLIRLIRVLKIMSSTWVIGALLACLVAVYVSLGIVLLVLGWTKIMDLILAGTIMNYITYAILIFMLAFIIVLFFVECAIAVVQYAKSDRQTKVSFGRWLLDFALDRPTYTRLERGFVLLVFIFMVIIAVSSVCDVKCSSAELYRTSTVMIHVVALFAPGGVMILLLELCRISIKRCQGRKGKRSKNAGEPTQKKPEEASSLSEASKQYRTFGDFMRQIIHEKGVNYNAFLRYCTKELSTENVLCLSDLLCLEQQFQQQDSDTAIIEFWKQILLNYCERNAPLEVNLSGQVRKTVLETISVPSATEQDLLARIKEAMQVLQRAALDNCFDTYTRFNPNHGF